MRIAYAGLYRAAQWARGEPVFDALRVLEEGQWWSAERIREEQTRKLRTVVEAALEARHYRESWRGTLRQADEIRDLESFSQLPVLEKETLRSDPDAVRSPGFQGRTNTHVTTGSSGVPLRVTRSREAGAYGRASQLRGRGWFGVAPGDREVRFGGASIEQLGRMRARVIDRMMNRVRLNAGDLSEERLAEYLRTLRRVRPSILYGYPSAVAIFASYVERCGAGEEIGLKLVQTSSECLFPHRREAIERAFGCAVADEYGAAEVSILAMECPRGGMHQSAESLLVEILDDRDRPVPEGEPGQVVVTDLNNLAAPLVRYRLGDRARLIPGSCECGRGLGRIEVLQGSDFGTLELPDGRVIGGVVFYFVAESLITRPETGVAELVLRRTGAGVQVQVRSSGGDVDTGAVRRELVEVLGAEIPLSIEVVERIARPRGDKHRVLLQEDPELTAR